jgi:stage III sporulation protein AF
MVMGLILLLTIIAPVFSLFSMSQDELAVRLDRYQEELDKSADAEWKRITDKLLGHRHEQVYAYVKEQLAAAVKESVKQEYGMDVRHIEIVMKQDNPEQPDLERIELVVGGRAAGEEAGVQPIQPIQPVEISIDPVSASDIAPPDTAVHTRVNNPLLARIASDIAAKWGLPEDQVVVTDESRQSEKN